MLSQTSEIDCGYPPDLDKEIRFPSCLSFNAGELGPSQILSLQCSLASDWRGVTFTAGITSVVLQRLSARKMLFHAVPCSTTRVAVVANIEKRARLLHDRNKMSMKRFSLRSVCPVVSRTSYLSKVFTIT